MREDDLIKSVEPIIDEITALNKKIDNVKTIKGDKGDEGEKGEQGAQGETGQEGIGVNTKEWSKGIYREGQIVQHFIGQQFKALKDTDKEPSNGEDWERIGTTGFRWTGVKSDKAKYEDGDLFIDSGTTFLMVDGKAKMFAQRGKNAVDGKDGVDGKSAREFVHVKWHSDGISFVYDDGEIVEADVDGLNEIQKRMTFIEEMFESNETIDAPIKRYAGAYRINTSYAVGDTVTEAKSLYLCIKADANSNTLDPEKWVKICNSQSSGKGSSGAFLPLAGGTMTGIIGSKSKEFASLKLNSLQEINVREKNGGLDINLQPEKSSTFRIANGSKAGLTIDGKHIVTASKEQDDELVKETASDYYLTTRKYVYDLHMKNYNSIVDLEEEIDAIVPAQERGTWNVKDANSVNRPPEEGAFYLMDANDVSDIQITRDLSKANTMLISHTDASGAEHTFLNPVVGDHIEIMRTGQPDYVLGQITGKNRTSDDHTTYTYSIDSSFGTLDGSDVQARVKILNLSTGLFLESLMPKSGGTFTGNVGFRANLNSDDEPSVITIKNLPPKNADGTDNIDKKFTLALDLDEGDTGNNRFAITTRKAGELLTATGGKYNSVFYNKKTDEFTYAHEIVTKVYVDLMTLSSPTEGYRVVVPGSGASPYNLGRSEFATDVKDFPLMSEIYVDEIYIDDKTTVRHARDYRPTATSEFQIWYGGVLQMAMNIYPSSWQPSRYDSEQRSFKGVHTKPYAAVPGIYTASRYYTIRLTNMRYASY